MIRGNIPDHGLLPRSSKFTSVSGTHAHIGLAIMSVNLYTLYSTNQNTSSTIIRNSITDIKCLNIANISRKLPKFSM